MSFGGSLARNIDFDVANFQLLVKTRRNRSIFELQLVKVEGGLARKACFGAFTCVIACLWLRRLYGGSCKTFRLSRCQSVKIGGSLAQNARFGASTCVVLSSWLSSGSAVSMGEAAKSCLFEGFEAGCDVVSPGRGGTS